MGRRVAHTIRMIEILSDGEWHSIREVAIEGSRLIPEIQAIQYRERSISYGRNKDRRNIPSLWRERTRDEQVRVGSYQIARHALGKIITSEKFEVRGELVRMVSPL